MKGNYLERALFVVAGRHCGKSTQLRSMFLDVRLGTSGEIPKDRKLKDFHVLTNDRFLYLRLSSPHETEGIFERIPQKDESENRRRRKELGEALEFCLCVAGPGSQRKNSRGISEPGPEIRIPSKARRVGFVTPTPSPSFCGGMLDRCSHSHGQRALAGRFLLAPNGRF
jgi:hypothetical protein